MKNLIFCFGILVLGYSCSNSQATSKDSSNLSHFNVLYLEEYGGEGVEKTEVFSDAESFAKMWNSTINSISGSVEVPSVDFSKNRVVVHHFPSQNSGGSTYEIQSVKENQDKTEIFYKITPPEGMSTMAITNPLIIIEIKKSLNPTVEFKIQK